MLGTSESISASGPSHLQGLLLELHAQVGVVCFAGIEMLGQDPISGMEAPCVEFGAPPMSEERAENWRGGRTRSMGGRLWGSSPQALILPLAPVHSSDSRLRQPDIGFSRIPDTPM